MSASHPVRAATNPTFTQIVRTPVRGRKGGDPDRSRDRGTGRDSPQESATPGTPVCHSGMLGLRICLCMLGISESVCTQRVCHRGKHPNDVVSNYLTPAEYPHQVWRELETLTILRDSPILLPDPCINQESARAGRGLMGPPPPRISARDQPSQFSPGIAPVEGQTEERG